MKKLTLLFLGILFFMQTSAQVFNTGQTLKQGTFAIGIEPALHINGGGLSFYF